MQGNENKKHDTSGSCDHEWLLGPFVDGELPPGEREAFEMELESSEGCSCKTLAEQLRNLDDLAHASAPPPRVSSEEWGQLWENIQREARPLPLRAQKRMRDWMIPAFSAAALILLGVWIGSALLDTSPTPAPGPDETAQAEIKIDYTSDDEAEPELEVQDDGNVITYDG